MNIETLIDSLKSGGSLYNSTMTLCECGCGYRRGDGVCLDCQKEALIQLGVIYNYNFLAQRIHYTPELEREIRRAANAELDV